MSDLYDTDLDELLTEGKAALRGPAMGNDAQ
jgi:hypothetical protein